jgi:predicted RND superfamily exporter protein
VKNTTFSKIEHLFALLIKNRMLVVLAVAISTAIMAYLASHVEVKTVFSDLLPKNHPYVEVNQKFKSTFGGSNMVSIMVEVQDGDIFKKEVLEKVQKLTVGLQQVDAVDTFQIVSIASKKTKEVRASTEGVESRPIMWPQLPKDDAEMAILREAVLNNPLIYGPYVSIDLKATLITADFLDQEINYSKAFEQIMGLVKDAEGDGVHVRVVGEPVLYGWVNFYLDETIQIFFAAIASLVLILL